MTDFLASASTDEKSKSQLKRDALALRALGSALVELNKQQLHKVPLDEVLRSAITAAQAITSYGAKRRQLLYIGKLLRARDPQPLQQALAIFNNQDQQTNARLHRLEQLRDAFIQQGDAALPIAFEKFPNADRQVLRQLIRRAHQEYGSATAATSARSLFCYLRDLSTEPNL